MNRLTIEHLSPYLPYKLVVWHRRHSYPKSTSLRELTPTVLCYVEVGGINTIKPILRPISDLTKEINHRGETFVPWMKLRNEIKSNPIVSHIDEFKSIHVDFEDYAPGYSLTHEGIPIINKLHSWLFDTQNLIESGLAISVHDLEFNPYEK